MKMKKIVVLGVSRWAELFIYRIAHACNVETQQDPQYRFLACETDCDEQRLRFVTTFNGNLNPKKQENIEVLFHGTNLIVYLISEVLPKDSANKFEGDAKDQRDKFRLALQQAKAHNVLWSNIPWVWVSTRTMPVHYKAYQIETEYINPLHNVLTLQQHNITMDMDSKADFIRLAQYVSNILKS